MWQQQAACGLQVKCLIGPRRILAWRPFESGGNWVGKDVDAFCRFMNEQDGVVEEEAAAAAEEAVHAGGTARVRSKAHGTHARFQTKSRFIRRTAPQPSEAQTPRISP
jgi:hypothetical protein